MSEWPPDDTPVDELELCIRSYNCLRNEGLTTVGEVRERTEAELMRTPNFGRKSLNEIKALIGPVGRPSPKRRIADLCRELSTACNRLADAMHPLPPPYVPPPPVSPPPPAPEFETGFKEIVAWLELQGIDTMGCRIVIELAKQPDVVRAQNLALNGGAPVRFDEASRA